MAHPAVFFDRDGIVNQSPGPGYVERPEDFQLLPEFVAALRVVQARGWRAVIITNQRGVALGRMTHADVARIHARLARELAAAGLALPAIYYCPHDRDQCACRKPQPGMLLQAARELDLDLAGSWMVGDNETDVEAGRRAGCRTVLVRPGAAPTAAAARLADLADLAGFLEQQLEPT